MIAPSARSSPNVPHSVTIPVELVLLIGLQASGKTTFYRNRFAATHAHVSKDLMRNIRHRERRQNEQIVAALSAGKSVVVDNTNISAEVRAPAIQLSRELGALVSGYYFESRLEVCLARNASREGRARVADVALRAMAARLERPSLEEGFDALSYVVLVEGQWIVKEWLE